MNVSGNNLDQMPLPICTLPRLRSLDLSHNNIRFLPPQVADSSTLTSLSLQSNDITQLPSSLASMARSVQPVAIFVFNFELCDAQQPACAHCLRKPDWPIASSSCVAFCSSWLVYKAYMLFVGCSPSRIRPRHSHRRSGLTRAARINDGTVSSGNNVCHGLFI